MPLSRPFYQSLSVLVASEAMGAIDYCLEEARAIHVTPGRQALIRGPTTSLVMLVIKPKSGRILSVNEVAAAMLHQPVDELIGQSIWSLFPPHVTDYRKPIAAQVAKTGQPLRFLDTARPTTMYSSVHPIFNGDGRVAQVLIMACEVDFVERIFEIDAPRRDTPRLIE